MDGRKNGCGMGVDKRKEGRKEGRCLDGRWIDRWMNGRMYVPIFDLIGRWMVSGWADGRRMDGWMDRWMDV